MQQACSKGLLTASMAVHQKQCAHSEFWYARHRPDSRLGALQCGCMLTLLSLYWPKASRQAWPILCVTAVLAGSRLAKHPVAACIVQDSLDNYLDAFCACFTSAPLAAVFGALCTSDQAAEPHCRR